MTDYPESGIKLVADTREYTSAMDYAIFQADYFDSLGDITLVVSAEVDMSGLDNGDLPVDGETIDVTVEAQVDGDLADLPLDGETVNFTVEAQVDGDLADLPLDGETVNFTAEGEVTGDAADLPKDGEAINTEIDVQETDTAAKTLGALETLKNLKVMETVWNIAGNAADVIGKFANFSVTPMLDLQDAVARVNAQTGDAIPNAEHLIKGIFYDDLGDSIDQVADLVTQAHNLKLPIDEAVRSALIFTHTFKNEDPTQVLNTIDAMLQAHIAPDAQTAGDLLVTAFQNGENKGKDLLKAIQDNANAIQGMGLTGPEALSFIKTGLDNGITSADGVLKALEKIKQNVTGAAGNESSDVTKTLNILGIANPAETGEAWSAEFFTKVIEGIKNQPGLSDTEKEVLFTNLIGGKQGGKTFAAFMKMSPSDAASIFENVSGAASTAATEIDNSLRGAIDDFMLAAQDAAEQFLSSDQIDLPGKINALKTGLQDGLNVLAEGGDLSSALTVALKPIGLDETFGSLESTMGNFIISILQVVSQLQSMSPDNWDAKKGTDATIARLGAKQLDYDLKIANPEDVQTQISTAVSRGLSEQQVAETVSGVITELIKTGTADSLAQAQLLVDTLNKPVDQNTLPTLASGAPMNVQPVITPEDLAKLQQQIKDAAPSTVIPAAVDPNIDKLTQQFGTLTPSTDALATSATNATEPVKQQAAATAAVTTAATPAAPAIKAQADATKTVGDNATKATKPVADVGKELGSATGSAAAFSGAVLGMVSALDMVTGKIQAFNTAAGAAATKAAAGTGGDKAVTGHAAGTLDASGTFMAGEDGPEIITSNQHVAVLNNQSTQAIMAALQGYVPGASGSKGGSVSNTINNFNTIPNMATADALGYKQSETLRGMS